MSLPLMEQRRQLHPGGSWAPRNHTAPRGGGRTDRWPLTHCRAEPAPGLRSGRDSRSSQSGPQTARCLRSSVRVSGVCPRVHASSHSPHRLSVNSGLSASSICPSSPHAEPSRALKGPGTKVSACHHLAGPASLALAAAGLPRWPCPSFTFSVQVLGRVHPWDSRAFAASSQRGLGPG